MNKIFIIFCLGIIFSVFNFTAYAEDINSKYIEFYKNFSKGYIDNECKYIESFEENRHWKLLNGGSGVIGAAIDDFDNDGQNEMVFVSIKYDENKNVNVYYSMYEFIDGNVKKNAEINITKDSYIANIKISNGIFTGEKEINDYGVKDLSGKKILFAQNKKWASLFADGVESNFSAYEYNGKQFINLMKKHDAGSAYYKVDIDSINEFRKIGFDKCADKLSKEFSFAPEISAVEEENIYLISSAYSFNNYDGTFKITDSHGNFNENCGLIQKNIIEIPESPIIPSKNAFVYDSAKELLQNSVLKNGDILISVEDIAQLIECTVYRGKDNFEDTIKIHKDNTDIEFIVDSIDMKVNKVNTQSSLITRIISDKAMVSLKSLCKALNIELD